VVIHDLVSLRIASFPTEDDAPLVVDAQASITGQITTQPFHSIAGRDAQTIQTPQQNPWVKSGSGRTPSV